MKTVGITGGVGAGKSEVLKLIKEMTDCVIVTADELAKSLEKKGEVCFEPLLGLLGMSVLGSDGEIDPKKMAAVIFSDGNENMLAAVDSIIHPAVKARILEMIGEEEKKGTARYFFIEAALLIEDGYDKIVDELWYIYADEGVRRERLRSSRGYSDERIDGIIRSQGSDQVFRKHCSVIIDNSKSLDETACQLRKILEGDEPL